jgi:hypothetical protein
MRAEVAVVSSPSSVSSVTTGGSKMAIKEGECRITAVPSLTANASKRTLLARQYIQGAAAFAELSVTLQSQEPSPLHMAYVAGTVFLSVAALEAAVNAILIDDPDWDALDRLPLLDKCERALARHNSAAELQRGTIVCQRVAALIRLRDELVHYKPEWDDNLKAHERFRRKFQSVIPPSVLPENFPNDYMTCDFAVKAVEWSGDFARDLFSKLGMAEEQAMWDIPNMEVRKDAPCG